MFGFSKLNCWNVVNGLEFSEWIIDTTNVPLLDKMAQTFPELFLWMMMVVVVVEDEEEDVIP